ERPAQLAGKRYASFGTEFEVPMVEHLIRHDGGTGAPILVDAEKLDILAALYAGEIDLAWGFYAWEGLQAELAGQHLRHFFVAEHGVPNEYFPLLFTSRALAEREPELVRAFVRATGRGYRFAAEQPDTAAVHFLRQVPAELLPALGDELVRRSARWLAPRFAQLATPTVAWGWHDDDRWRAFAAFVRELAQEHGLTAPEPDAETAGYTNALLA
ncbi:MAG TPA: ABC transporter substrate-binding protein, partial [Ktedonobacterales bacterium]|nr:ABC transporter substrate-binding protein [Ktedonobacterales bacterium]